MRKCRLGQSRAGPAASAGPPEAGRVRSGAASTQTAAAAGPRGAPMSLSLKLSALAEAGTPVRVGVIGAGKFGSMFLSQAPRTPGLHVVGIADLSAARARESLARVGWPAERAAARSFAEAMRAGTTCIVEDSEALIAADGIDVVVEATGSPAAGIRHVLSCCRHRRHVVMVNVEA